MKEKLNLQEFTITRSFKVYAKTEEDAEIVLDQQLIEMSESMIALKRLTNVLRENSDDRFLSLPKMKKTSEDKPN